MSFPNRTGLNLDTSGTLAGKRFTVVGRVVMGMEEEGQTYHWNEFHLVDEANQSATLVYEEAEQAGQWKLFTSVESARPLSAYEAATKRVGDRINLDGRTAHVTLVDESKVCFIEGRPPEGVELGDAAKYFNAVADNRMYVVSWTGPEVEVFRGMDLPTSAVVSAFNLRPPLPLASTPAMRGEAAERHGQHRGWMMLVLLLVGGVGVASFFSCRSTKHRSATHVVVPVKSPAPPAPLTLGTRVQLGDKLWRADGHALVEVRTPRATYERHEYHLVSDGQVIALLVYSLDAGRTNGCLLQPTPLSLSPLEAASRRLGAPVSALGQSFKVKELFLTTVRSAEGELPFGLASGTVAYNLRAESDGVILLARWTETGISGHVGKPITSSEVMRGLGERP